MLLKNIESNIIENPLKDNDEVDIISDIRYVCKACALITSSLERGCDVMQMSNGDIVITELMPVTFQYTWDDQRGKLIRKPYGNRSPQIRPRKTLIETTEEVELA